MDLSRIYGGVLNDVLIQDVLFRSITAFDPPAVKMLLERKVDANLSHNGTNPLVHAVTLGQYSIVQLLLQHGANPNLVLPNGRSVINTICKDIYYTLDEDDDIEAGTTTGTSVGMLALITENPLGIHRCEIDMTHRQLTKATEKGNYRRDTLTFLACISKSAFPDIDLDLVDEKGDDTVTIVCQALNYRGSSKVPEFTSPSTYPPTNIWNQTRDILRYWWS
jgi:hypothetical protein